MAITNAVGPDAFGDVVCKFVAESIEENEQIMRERVRLAGKVCAETLREVSPKLTGEYAAGWQSRAKDGGDSAVSTVYNKAKPELVHLLEFGHGLVYFGHPTHKRVGPKPHLDKGYQAGAKELSG